jgi:hypothetical protein
LPRVSTSLPMPTMAWNMSFMLPAIVISSTWYWMTPPFSPH